jgi:hypothetical protein
MSTYVPIQAITLSSATASVTFTGIPQTFSDLVLVFSVKANTANLNTGVRFNSDTATNYSNTTLEGNGTTATSQRHTSVDFIRTDGSSVVNTTSFGIKSVQINNYSNTTTNKTTITRSNSAGNGVDAMAGLWRNASSISSVTVYARNDSFASDSQFTLYGIGSGSPKAFGGDEVRTDGTYWYHIFRSSSSFEPVQNLSNVDYLVIAGGGAGGYGFGGGGGAGGYRSSVTGELSGGAGSPELKLSLLSNTRYTVTIGAGGTSGNSSAIATSGSNSVFGTITSIGGGGGGCGGGGTSTNGRSGGSGGGVRGRTNIGAAGTALQGYAGGDANYGNTSITPASGGGGAGSLGGNAINNGGASGNGGVGGSGVSSSITGTSVTRAGGGGGAGRSGGETTPAGAGGSGGGGAGSQENQNATAGTVNTGSGGGGSGSGTGSSGAGGSGIVIVRYLV